MIGNASVYRLRHAPGGMDRYGDATSGEVDRLLIEGAAVAPRSTDDNNDRGRQGVIVGLSLYTPYGADLIYTDQVEVDGAVYDIEGEPGKWKNPLTSWEAGIEVALKRAAG